MKSYRLKLTALTPIHIGTGEVYEPTNFVIDSGFLYEFDEIEFYKNLNDNDKKIFNQTVNKKDSLMQIYGFIKNHKEIAKKVSYKKVKVTSGIDKDYEKKIAKVVQIEGGKKGPKRNIFNQFIIEKSVRDINSNRVYIPGSSIKGSISTAYQEYIFKRYDKKELEKLFENRNPSQNFFKNLSISDTMIQKAYSMIGYALNKERFEDDELGPKTIVETIYSNSKNQTVLNTTITIKDFDFKGHKLEIETIKKACNDHYMPIFRQQFEPYTKFKGKKVDDYTNEYFSDRFYETYKDFSLKENQFLLRVGKYSQARAVTIEGIREIRVKISGGGPKRKPNKWETLDQETTTWMFGSTQDSNQNLLPFGWVVCEIL